MSGPCCQRPPALPCFTHTSWQAQLSCPCSQNSCPLLLRCVSLLAPADCALPSLGPGAHSPSVLFAWLTLNSGQVSKGLECIPSTPSPCPPSLRAQLQEALSKNVKVGAAVLISIYRGGNVEKEVSQGGRCGLATILWVEGAAHSPHWKKKVQRFLCLLLLSVHQRSFLPVN